MPIIRYVRTLTADQDITEQRRRLEEEFGANQVFEDMVSGRSFERPGLAKMLDYARSSDTIWVARLDQLGRSLNGLLETIETFREACIALRSLGERLETGTAARELVFHVFRAIAHFERRLIDERTRDGLRTACVCGVIPSRPRLNVEKLESAVRLMNGGLSITRAAQQLGIGRSILYQKMSVLKQEEAMGQEQSANVGQASI